jgi:hypothetical protein
MSHSFTARPALGKLTAFAIIMLIFVATGLTSCSSRGKRTAQQPPAVFEPIQGSSPAPGQARSDPNSGKSAPIADRLITLAGSCSQTEEDGFREQASIAIEKNEVKSLNWQLWVGKRGSCQFDLKDFTQTQKSPHIELRAKNGSGCRLLVWQTPDRVTLAHNSCQKSCSPGVYDDAWPVMFNPKTGNCAALG